MNRHDDHIRAFCFTFDEPIDPLLFDEWLSLLVGFKGPNILRIKGILNLKGEDKPTVVHGVQHIFHPTATLPQWPSEDRRSRIVFITRDIERATIERSFDAFLEGSLAMRLAREYDQESETLLEPLGRYREDVPASGSSEARVALVELGRQINAMHEDGCLSKGEALGEAADVAGLAQKLGIAMAHRWLRLAAAMEVEDWRLRHPNVAPAPVGQRLLWSSRSDPKRAPGRVLTWLWLGFGYVARKGGITHASQVSYRDLMPDEAALELTGYHCRSLNENPLRWMERHGSGDQPLSVEKLAALMKAWASSNCTSGGPSFAPVTWWAIGSCALRAERWLAMLPSVTAADYLRYWEEARLMTENKSAPDSTLAAAPIWMQPDHELPSAR